MSDRLTTTVGVLVEVMVGGADAVFACIPQNPSFSLGSILHQHGQFVFLHSQVVAHPLDSSCEQSAHKDMCVQPSAVHSLTLAVFVRVVKFLAVGCYTCPCGVTSVALAVESLFV